VHEHHAIIPNADRSALLVVEGRLPVVHTAERQQLVTLATLEELLGVRCIFLRTVRRSEDDEKRLTTLFEIDSVPRRDGTWLRLESVDASAVEPRFPDGLEEWLAEQRGSPIPPQRAQWARPGWLSRVTEWVDGIAGVRGEPRLVRQWQIASIYVFETELGQLYLKACFALWPHEPAISAALAREHPGAVADVVAVTEDQAWLLMRELCGTPVSELSPAAIPQMFEAVANIQRSWTARADALVALGAPFRGLERLAAHTPELAPLCERLAAVGIPETLTHGDLHQWNAVVDEGRVVVFDWSDAAVAHPFLDLGPAIFYAELDGCEREPLVDAYLEPWRGVAPEARLREAAALGEVLGCVYQAVSYRAINAAFEPLDRWLWDGEWNRWTERALELAARL
jgi:hypothetical protein